MVRCKGEPCRSQRVCLGAQNLSTCLSALQNRRSNSHIGYYGYFLPNWWKRCLAGLSSCSSNRITAAILPCLPRLCNICKKTTVNIQSGLLLLK